MGHPSSATRLARWMLLGVSVACLITPTQSGSEVTGVPNGELRQNVLFESALVRAFSLAVQPRTQTVNYICNHDCVIIPLTDSTFSDVQRGMVPQTLHLMKGEPQFFTAGSVHSLRNETDELFLAVAVDMLVPSPEPAAPKCDCEPRYPAGTCGCGGGAGGILIADGEGNWMHQRTQGRMTIRTYGLLPVATFVPKARSGSLPEFAIEASPNTLLIAVDDVSYRQDTSDLVSQLASGTILNMGQKAWIAYPNPPQCTWENVLVKGKVTAACKATIFVTVSITTARQK